MSQIPQSYTRAGPLIPRGERLQEPIDAIREIWAYLASLDGREAFYPQERFQATIISGFPVAQTNSLGSGVPMSGNSPDYTDARYCVVRVLTYQSNVNDLPPLGVDQDSTNTGVADATYVTATNLAEILGGNGHILPTNGSLTVEVFGVWDVGNPQQKHYYFCTMPAVAWIKLTSVMPPASLGSPTVGGGGFYNARLMTGSPMTIDPKTDLVMPFSPAEAIPSTDNILAENCIEANLGDPAVHFVRDLPCFVPAWWIGLSKESTPRPVYRFAYPRIDRWHTLKITGYFGGSGGTGGARYKAVLVTGWLDGTPSASANMSLPDSGETVGTTTVCYESDPENAITQSHLLPIGAFVEARWVGPGLDNTGTLIAFFRGTGLPIGMFPVKVKNDGGVQGTAVGSVNCSLTYSIFYADDNGTGNRPIYLGTTLTPDVPRFPACKYNKPSDYSPGLAYYIPGSSTPHLYSAAQEIPTTQLVTNIVNIQVVDASQTIQIQTKNELVLDADTTSGWQTIYTGATCP